METRASTRRASARSSRRASQSTSRSRSVSRSGSNYLIMPDPPQYNPTVQFPKYDLKRLPDPPDDFAFFGLSMDRLFNRRYTSEQLRALIDFHCWGMDPGIDNRPNGKASRVMQINVLRKLVYHMAEQHAPSSFREFCNTTRDAGPRLLKLTLNPTPLPISRYYPKPPKYPPASNPAFQRPEDFPDSVWDSFIERCSHPSSGGPPVESDTADDNVDPPRPPVPPFPGVNVAPNLNAFFPSVQGAHPQTSAPIMAMSGAQQNYPVAGIEQSFHDTAQAFDMAVTEAIERAVMKFAYQGLERHPRASPLEVRPHYEAASPEDLLKGEAVAASVISKVRLLPADDRGTTLTLHPEGRSYDYQGRGPVGKGNSGVVDCCIVAGKLLDAGSTVVDRLDDLWENQLTKVEKAFMEAIDLNWDLFSNEQSIRLRDRLSRLIEENVPNLEAERPIVQTVWQALTRSFGQFMISCTEDRVQCSRCHGGQQNAPNLVTVHTLAPRFELMDSTGVIIHKLLEREFSVEEHDCASCEAEKACYTRKRVHHLPMRLAVMPDPNARLENHATQNIGFEYFDTYGSRQKAMYRWLGGIYTNNEGRYRVYWTDTARGERENFGLKMYDSMHNAGVIVGKIPWYQPDELVPPEWAGGAIPLLFYERILNPSKEVLVAATQAVNTMSALQGARQFILPCIPGWNRPAPLPVPTQFERLLNDHNGRIYNVQNPQVVNTQSDEPSAPEPPTAAAAGATVGTDYDTEYDTEMADVNEFLQWADGEVNDPPYRPDDDDSRPDNVLQAPAGGFSYADIDPALLNLPVDPAGEPFTYGRSIYAENPHLAMLTEPASPESWNRLMRVQRRRRKAKNRRADVEEGDMGKRDTWKKEAGRYEGEAHEGDDEMAVAGSEALRNGAKKRRAEEVDGDSSSQGTSAKRAQRNGVSAAYAHHAKVNGTRGTRGRWRNGR